MTAASLLPRGVTVLERGWLSSNNVLFVSGRRTAIVDTGYGTHAAQTIALVRNALDARELDLIVNTHLHSDHCGGNAALQWTYPTARTVIPPGHSAAVESWDEEVLTYRATGQVCGRFRFDDVLAPGSEIELGEAQWEVHAAPGHDPHSVILFEPKSRTLISADALWEGGFGVVFPELEGEPGFGEVAATLDLIESLDPRVVIPGHGGLFGGREKIAASLSTARRRLVGLAADPVRHAAHATKVLIKFKLLEWNRVSESEFVEWGESTPYLRLIHARFFPGADLASWLLQLVDEMVSSKALAREAGVLGNI